MTVIKIKHQKEFSTLSNQVLQDPNLSIEAIGIWAHCMSRPEDWTFHISQLCTQFKIGKEKIHKIINELIANGYAFRGQKMEVAEQSLAGNRKVFSKIEYIFFPYKITKEEYEKLKKEYPGSDFKKCFSNGNLPFTESPLPENQPLQKKDVLHIKEDINTEANAPEPLSSPSKQTKQKKAPEEKMQVADRVFLTPSQVNALKKRLEGSKITLQAIYDKLSTWKLSKDIWGGSDFRTIITWVIDACLKDSMDKPTQGSPNPPSSVSKTESKDRDRMMANQIERKFHDLIRVSLIYVSNESIEFNLGDRGGNVKVYFGSGGFRDICLKYLRQLNQDTTGL